jgi:ATP-binding cassette subfamily B protein
VRSLDRILVFDGGRIVEDGSHDDLLSQPEGRYRALFERQAGVGFAADVGVGAVQAAP